MSDWREGRPYRLNVGICLINKEGLVWFGKSETAGPEIVSPGREWQMPQGGIEETENIVESAKRELWEETGASSVKLLAVTKDWWSYDFPVEFSSVEHKRSGHKLDSFRGQKQRWVAFSFEGLDSEISITADHTDEPQEFLDWRWFKMSEVFDIVVDYKLQQYRRVYTEFSQFMS